jgi:hypothetical protein
LRASARLSRSDLRSANIFERSNGDEGLLFTDQSAWTLSGSVQEPGEDQRATIFGV